ncbi:HAMP domain-containing sensor histidine kinase [Bacteroides sp. 214]|uniref:sensor histidine kinase n=1 Tax=Bacteroides sp. 214 TaxID=2302935 RepID=UPI0013D3D746|nr:HAMP domain-containing sensor histidine kinase [Bacteroides sp. 214]
MKRLLLILFCIMLLTVSITGNTPAQPAEFNGKRVLVINSYSEEVYWSNAISSEIKELLQHKHPELDVHLEQLYANTAPLRGVLNMALRPILWSFSKEETQQVSANYTVNSMLQTDRRPHVIVIVGDEGLLAYQNLQQELGDWKEIPLVLCAVNDSIIKGDWNPEDKIDFSELIPIEERRAREYITSSQPINMFADQDEQQKQGIKTIANYQITGVKTSLPIDKNLNFIHSLMPKLKKLTWVDSYYYGAAYAERSFRERVKQQLPDIKVSSMFNNTWNTDSIYDEILLQAENEVYITYSWEIAGLSNHRSDLYLSSQFRKHSSVPLFSLRSHNSINSYWTGGCYENNEEYCTKTVTLVERVLRGEAANDIPFELAEGEKYMLNKELVKRYKLSANANKLNNIQYFNIPPPFFRKYEKEISGFFLATCVLIAFGIYIFFTFRFHKKKEEEARRYKRLHSKLQTIYSHSIIDFALYDEKGNCLYCIAKGKRHTKNIEWNSVFSSNFFESPHLPEDAKKSLREQKELNLTIQRNDLKEEDRIFQLILFPLKEKVHDSACYIAIAISMSPVLREKSAKEHYERLSQFVSESSKVGISYYDIATKIANTTPSYLINLDEWEEGKTEPTYNKVLSEDQEFLFKSIKEIQKGERQKAHKEIHIIDEEGNQHWVNQYIYSLWRNSKKYMIGLNMNIDEQKKNEERLKQAKLQAEQAIVDTEKFIQNINHEIRTPLNAIVGFSEIISLEINDEENAEFISLIKQNNKLLTMLIDNIIELSVIDSGNIENHPQEIAIKQYGEESERFIRNNLYGKNIATIIEIENPDEIILIDRKHFFTVVFNLLSNAIKFTETGSITIGYERRPDEHYFYVRDTGCGISPENIKFIFRRFEKLDTFIQGTGLGLSLSKRIVKSLGGKMGVESELDKGSTFWWTLPL